ncbi:hypothetical protein EBAPG3_010705 [Nitrosospira lacus]|nr:hypothetical protein EBAPG3_010705 [Nitrosospira lacus]
MYSKGKSPATNLQYNSGLWAHTILNFMFILTVQTMNNRRFPQSIKKEMTEYVLYIRSKTGAIERKSSYPIFWCYEWLLPYAHEEPLIGWPESKVFWAREIGPSVGIAPVASTPPD